MRAVRNRVTARQILVVLVGIVAVSAIALFVVQRVTELPAADAGYAVSVAPGIQPVTAPARAAALARHYLDEQTPELAAPEIHRNPAISGVTATLARDARSLEPLIPVDAVDAQPERIVWVVRASGDFLNLHDLPWSQGGTPDPGGSIVIDDATGAILGVYPHDPGT